MAALLSDSDLGIGGAGGNLLSDADMGLGPTPTVAGEVTKAAQRGPLEGADVLRAVGQGPIGMFEKGAYQPIAAAANYLKPSLNLPSHFLPNVSDAINKLAPGYEQSIAPDPNATAGPRYAGAVTEAVTNPAVWVGPGGLATKAGGAILSSILGQAGADTGIPGAQFVGSMAGGTLGGVAGQKVGNAGLRASPVPTAAELKQAGSQGFETARNLGVEIKPQSVQDFAARVAQDLDQGLGVDANLAPKTHGILADVAKGPPAGGNAVATIDNLQSLRRKLGNAAGSIDKTERMAASSAKNALDDYLANLPSSDVIAGNPQTAAAILRDANANYAAASRSEGVNAKLVRAELRAAAANSGQNVANTIRQRMADILINPTLQRGYSRDELAQIEKIVRGTFVGNTGRFVKNVLGGGGGIGTLATAGVGAAAGGLPGLALAVPGIAGRLISDASTMRQVRKLDQMLRSRAPLSAQQAAGQPLPQSHLNLLKALLLSNAATLSTRMPSAQVLPNGAL